MTTYVSQRAKGFIPNAPGFALFKLEDQNSFRKIYKRAAIMRIALSLIILIGLTAFILRKTTVAYEYTVGMKEFKLTNYGMAARHLQSATKADPGFAMAWDRLAWSEYKLHNKHEAERYWHKALFYKPDLVESKIGLAELYIEDGNFLEAERLLNQCIRLSPYQTGAYLDLAKIYRREDKVALSEVMLDRAVKCRTDNMTVYLKCIKLYKEYGLLDKAGKLAAFVLQNSPDNLETQQLFKQSRESIK